MLALASLIRGTALAPVAARTPAGVLGRPTARRGAAALGVALPPAAARRLACASAAARRGRVAVAVGGVMVVVVAAA